MTKLMRQYKIENNEKSNFLIQTNHTVKKYMEVNGWVKTAYINSTTNLQWYDEIDAFRGYYAG